MDSLPRKNALQAYAPLPEFSIPVKIIEVECRWCWLFREEEACRSDYICSIFVHIFMKFACRRNKSEQPDEQFWT